MSGPRDVIPPDIIHGGPKPPGDDHPNGDTICQTLYKGATLASPKRTVLSTVQKGEVLSLEPNPQDHGYTLHAFKAGDRVGVVTHKLVHQIIRCITEEGHTYVAYVRNIDGGHCTLDIRMEA